MLTDRHIAPDHITDQQRLTARELEILTLLAEGLTHTQIGKRLHSSESVVRATTTRIAVKWCVPQIGRGRSLSPLLVALAYQNGYLAVSHRFISPACAHHQHGDCGNPGPAVCGWCQAVCLCGCHARAGLPAVSTPDGDNGA